MRKQYNYSSKSYNLAPPKFDWNIGYYLDDNDIQSEGGGDYEQEDFIGCCGAEILYGFPSVRLNNKQSLKDIKEHWQEYADNYVEEWAETDAERKQIKPKIPSDAEFNQMIKEYSEVKFGKFNDGHIYVIILNEQQKGLFPTLKESGFRLVSDRTVNKNTGNRLYVFLRDHLTPKPKVLKKSAFKRATVL